MPPTYPPADLLPVQVLVLAKEPVAGRVKTRLTPPLTPAQAAQVAAAALQDTLSAVRGTTVTRRVLVLDGDPGALSAGDFVLQPQVAGGLGDRLAAAFATAWDRCPLPMLLVGMDTPQLTPALLVAAAAALLAHPDGVVGLAEDGGWWALGLSAPVVGAFAGVPMSTAGTGTAQLHRLAELGHPLHLLPVLKDIDHVEDIAPVAALAGASSALAAVSVRLGLTLTPA